MEQLLISGDDDIEHNAIGDYIRHNYLKLKVYVSSKTVEKIIELPKYDFFSFLASLGGATSLYLGMSFIVIFELFELFFIGSTYVYWFDWLLVYVQIFVVVATKKMIL